jgi:recombination protein RecA
MSKGVEKINKRYNGFIQMPGTYPMDSIEYTSTGSIGLDFTIGKPGVKCGIPRGMVTVIWGKEGSGKSTLMASCLFNALLEDSRMVALVDTEFKIDFDYYKDMGIDFSRVVLVQPNSEKGVYGEQLVEGMSELVLSGEYSIVACDSLAGLEPKALVEDDVTESRPGIHARLVSRLFSKVLEKAKRANTAVLLTSQRRANFGSQSFAGPSYNIVGGNRMKFQNCLQMKTTMMKRIKEGDDVVGIESKVELDKNTGIPYNSATIYITNGLGLDWGREMFELGKPYGIAYNRGAWYYYTNKDTGEEVAIGQGMKNAVEFLRGNPEVSIDIMDRVIAALEEEHAN